MQRVWQFLLNPRVLTVLGLATLAAFLFMGASALKVGLAWAAMLLLLVCLIWGGVWFYRRHQARKAAGQLEAAMDADANRALQAASADKKDEVQAVRERMLEAVKLIKSSKLGETSGAAALYELPWYAVIGNPAAGKSSAVVMSGLKFPFSDSRDQVIQGIGGTRHCDWYFTTEGILLDTAGRYAVHEEDRSEWLGFLSLLKKHRAKAPLNGVIIAVSVAELGSQRAEFAIDLARKLRQRVQELTERLEVFVPVYVVFTKADLIAGFVDFFEDRDRSERDKVWGATLPYDTSVKVDAAAQFDRHFDALFEGLKEASAVRMSLHRGEQLPPGVLTFPLEFAALKPALRTFMTTLFEDNPYQFQPIFRGFYFTSAVQEGQSTSRASERVASQFGLSLQSGTTAAVYSQTGFFLKDLFSKVIFSDRQLVQQYTSRRKLQWRYATFAGGVLALSALLGVWTWSYMGNRELVAHVQADLTKAQQIQQGRSDLQSRLEAMEIIQDRLEQIQKYRQDHPWSLGWGLYQGDAIEARLRQEYFEGLSAIMLKPASQAIAEYLAQVNAHASDLKPVQRVAEAASRAGGSAQSHAEAGIESDAESSSEQALASASASSAEASLGQPSAAQAQADWLAPPAAGAPAVSAAPVAPIAGGAYSKASHTNVTEAYNALKAYLMLGDRARIEPGHMSDQLTRFWRTWLDAHRGDMKQDQLVQRAERLLSFAVAQMADPAFPEQTLDVALLDQTRDNLRRVIKGMPARERVYAEIKARAATRYAPITVASLVGDDDRQYVAGSHAVSGAFTKEAWDDYIKDAFANAANNELQSSDWVLKTSMSDDLTLEGSPEQIQKALTQLYKTEYAAQWRQFVQGMSVAEFSSFDQAVAGMNRLGDPAASPVGKLLQTLHDQTSWDNPTMLNERLAAGQRGFVAWFKQSVLRMAPSKVSVDVNLSADSKEIPMGPIGREFAGVAKWMVQREGGDTLLSVYLKALSNVRGRFNEMKTQGDPGPAARKMMAETFEGSGELADALKLVDQQMLVGMGESSRQALRPLLVRPLMQAFGAVVRPTEAELNRVWMAQVYDPYQRTLASKYPFDRSSRVEASPAEIAKVFGAEGSVAKFFEQSMASLMVRRGDAVSPKTWADMGVRLRPEFAAGVGSWTAALAGQGGAGTSAGAGSGGAAAAQAQTVFQIMPLPAPGLTEYTVDIDGQVLRYRNGAANWAHFVWPGPGNPGVRITGVSHDGRSVEFFNEAGRYGLEKMIGQAQRRKLEGGMFELRWPQGPLSVAVQLRIISNAANPPSAEAGGGQQQAAGARDAAVIAGKPGALPPVIVGPAEEVPATASGARS